MNPASAARAGSTFLSISGILSPQFDAEVLLEFVLDIPRIQFYTSNDIELTEKELFTYRLMLTRRADGYPLQYIIGTTGFRGVNLYVEPGVFIPRPETEVLVDKAIEVLPSDPAHILDLCCGCGNICISLAREYSNHTFTAVDNNKNSIRLCDTNARKNNVQESIRILEGDLFNALAEKNEFDLIISNPPYIPISILSSLPREVRDHEPYTALVGGLDGLDVINRIVSSSPSYLKHGGWLILEAGEEQVDKIAHELRIAGGSFPKPASGSFNGELINPPYYGNKTEDTSVWSNVETFQDLTGRPRIVRARRASQVNEG